MENITQLNHGAKHSAKLLIFSLVLIFFTSCTMFKGKTPEQKREAEVAKLENTQKSIDEKTTKIEDKGKAFVYGAKYSLSQWQETNKPVEVKISERFIDLATLTIGNPSYSDAAEIRKITDGLLLEAQAELIRKEILITDEKTKTKDLEKKLKEYESKVATAEKQLIQFGGEIIKINNEKDNLIKQKTAAEIKLEELDKRNSEKATMWDADNSFLNSINPFSSLMDFFKKLFGWGVFLGIVFILFKVLEIFFPQLNILSVIFGFFIGIVRKIVPASIKGAGLVSSAAFDTLKKVVKANQDIFDKLEKMPIEDQLVENYPDNHSFNKKEVLDLLYKLTEKTLEEMKNEFKEHTDNESRAYIHKAKVEMGLKEESKI